MIFSNYDSVFYTILLIVPGFILNLGYTYLIPHREGQAAIYSIRFITYSCINYAIIWPFAHDMIMEKYWETHPFRWSLLLIIFLLALPYFLGLVIGIINGKDWIRRALRKGGINPIHPVPTGWDYIMPKTQKYVIITLKNGQDIYGLFSEKSMASSVPTEKDIYLEQIYSLSDEGDWETIARGEGMWVNGSEILHIEFRSTDDMAEEEDDNGEQEQQQMGINERRVSAYRWKCK